MATRIVVVIHEDGNQAHPPTRPNSTLFEICDGPHTGKRGADVDLYDLVGAIKWDPSTVSIYETGERVMVASLG